MGLWPPVDCKSIVSCRLQYLQYVSTECIVEYESPVIMIINHLWAIIWRHSKWRKRFEKNCLTSRVRNLNAEG